LENSIKNELNRKRKGMGHAVSEDKSAKRSKPAAPKKAVTEEAPSKKVHAKVAAAPAKSSSAASSSATNAPPPPGSEEYINNRTVYVQGLPFTATEQDIRTFFKDVGDIASIRLPKWHDSGKLKGYGHVEFKKAESATKALELNGEYLQDRYLSIDRPMVPRALTNAEAHEPSAKPAGCRTIFIKNLPYETTEAEITQSFMVFGPIKSVRLAVWGHTGKLKGIGYVDFKREDSAETAVKKSGTVAVQGRKILVDYETSAPKGSFKAKPGSLAPATAKK
jgi:nucleolin